ncbi:type III pantothenate kinase [Anaerocolumna xylanovorans]|uniref:Type III pantothenate kinase n=1 Tax=Anaerocolumna xylanovorans DSM 12503 TaxID=1121345 RepID=A0A1M7YN57_9FIRM|nr:type III pantothenate kinase [Anaerocolumna xylanovorans]SHO54070.1 pantothenate kinase [Anaerocolumna xylanovorans DSM 12503]
MLLVIDVGNTNITCGVFREEELAGSFRITTKLQRTSDEYGLTICELLNYRGIAPSEVEAVIIASVVPGIMHSLKNGIVKYLKRNPMEVGIGTKTGIKINVANPKEVGADRVVDAVAAYDIYGGPLIVIDFGTATTYDLISEDGTFLAGITSTGIRICADALWNETAKLPKIEIRKPESILATDTISSMQAGLVYGYIGQTEYIIRKIMEESKIPNIKVIATGGLGKIIADSTEDIHVYDPQLTLKGLRIIYSKNKR